MVEIFRRNLFSDSCTSLELFTQKRCGGRITEYFQDNARCLNYKGVRGGIGREGEEGETKTGIDAIILNSGAVSRDFLLCSY